MTYLSLYRRWRSQSFDEVVGQSHIVRTLKNSLNSGRISHAYLFSGPRGTGKTTLARLFAKGLNCVEGPTADFCGECPRCVGITQGNFLDVIEIDGASNRGIEEIRKLREQVQYAPVDGLYKVYIIDEVHMLTQDAFNALLKTLEEPPERVVFILATTDPQKIPTTILSRCQRYDFKRFPAEDIVNHLQYVLSKEGVVPEPEALEIIAEQADGGMRDALSIVDQCLAYSDHLSVEAVSTVLGVATRDRIIGFLQALDRRDGAELIKQIQDLYLDGKSLSQFVRDVLAFLRRAVTNETTLPDIGINWSNDRLLQVMAAFSECERDMRYVKDNNIPLELAVLHLIQPESPLEKLQERIDALEKKVRQLEQTGIRVADIAVQPKREEKQTPKVQFSPVNSDPDKLKTIQAHWQDYLKMLRNERLIQPEAFLREGYPVGLEGDQVIIGFPQGRGFHKASIEQDKHREPAERAMAKMFGFPLKIKCIMSDLKQQPEAVVGDAAPEPAENGEQPEQEYNEAVDAALKIFGGKVIKIKDD